MSLSEIVIILKKISVFILNYSTFNACSFYCFRILFTKYLPENWRKCVIIDKIRFYCFNFNEWSVPDIQPWIIIDFSVYPSNFKFFICPEEREFFTWFTYVIPATLLRLLLSAYLFSLLGNIVVSWILIYDFLRMLPNNGEF